ncbi:MAG: ribosome biogenesis GTPase Der [bacterium]
MTRRASAGSDIAEARAEDRDRVRGGRRRRPPEERGAWRPRAGELPVVAIVGRPNVGKSSLFNRLVGRRKALVQDTPGVTRDRITGTVDWAGRSFVLVDTGGLEYGAPSGSLSGKIRLQIERAIGEADLLLFVVDSRVPPHPEDEQIAGVLRRAAKPVICAANKIDTPSHEDARYAYYRLGLEPLVAVSAEHGLGVDLILDEILEALPPRGEPAPEVREGERPTRVAVVGRPNVGKSTLVNALLGDERQLVDELPGTTRDSVDTAFQWRERAYLLIDTAGIRRRGKVTAAVEKFAVIKALESLERCDVALLMLDAAAGVTEQDAHIGGYILEQGRGAVVLLNKWDLVRQRHARPRKLLDEIRSALPHLQFAPVVPVSARTGYNLDKALGSVARVEQAYRLRVPTAALNRLLEEAVASHPPPSEGKRLRRFHYMTQVKASPPTFALFSNLSGEVHFSYQRYLINRIRERFGFEGAPIRLLFRKRR